MKVFNLLKRLFICFFNKKTVVIVTDTSTKTLYLHSIVQFVLFVIIASVFGKFAYNYNRYKHYNNYALILKENDNLKSDHNELRKQFVEYDKLAEKINEYLSTLDTSDKKSDIHNKIKKSSSEIFSIKDMLGKLDEHRKSVYAFLERRRGDVVNFFGRLGFSGISYDKINKSVKITSNSAASINNISGNESVGGLNEPVRTIKVVKGKPLLSISNSKINDKNFLSEINKMIVLQKTINVLPFGLPTDGDYRITSSYGLRKDPINNNKALSVHRGMDMVLANKNIVATMDGVVIFAGFKNGYGNCIDIEHKTDNFMPSIVTHYAHLDKMFVSRGQFVSKGEKIGLQGNTGRSTGPHLHYEIRYNNISIDPSKFVKMESN